MNNFNWSEQTSPQDKIEGRKTYYFCTNPTAKLMGLIQLKNDGYLLTCLGKQKKLKPMPLEMAQKESVIWLMNNLREIQANLYNYVADQSELDSLLTLGI